MESRERRIVELETRLDLALQRLKKTEEELRNTRRQLRILNTYSLFLPLPRAEALLQGSITRPAVHWRGEHDQQERLLALLREDGWDSGVETHGVAGGILVLTPEDERSIRPFISKGVQS